jgi:hypothetical protein
MAGSQDTMATDGPEEATRAEALAQLLDRLSQRLPVWRLAPGESHWPERSAVRVGPFKSVPHAPRRSEGTTVALQPMHDRIAKDITSSVVSLRPLAWKLLKKSAFLDFCPDTADVGTSPPKTVTNPKRDECRAKVSAPLTRCRRAPCVQ